MFINEAITGKQERLINQMNKLCKKKFNFGTSPRLKSDATKYITENYSEFVQNTAFLKHIADGTIVM